MEILFYQASIMNKVSFRMCRVKAGKAEDIAVKI